MLDSGGMAACASADSFVEFFYFNVDHFILKSGMQKISRDIFET